MNDVVLPADAEAIASASSRRDESVARWNEVTIYRTPDGYAASTVGKTVLPGEHDRVQVILAPDALGITTGLQRGKKRMSRTAGDALRAALEVDAAFGAALDPETVTPGDQPREGSFVVTFPRERGMRPLRFFGRPIAIVRSRPVEGQRASEVVIYALDDGRFVVDVARVSDQTVERADRNVAPVRLTVALADTAMDTMDALLVNGGLTHTAFAALEAAAKNEPRFGEQIGARFRRAFMRQSILTVHPEHPTLIQRQRFSGIFLASDTDRTSHVRRVVYRALSHRRGVHYIVGTHTSMMPERVYALWIGDVSHLVAFLSREDVLLGECARRDRDVARALGYDVGGATSDDPLAATLPRESAGAKPPLWPTTP